MKWGTVATALYILIGLAGVPVFAGFTSGPAKLLGPTGGYMIGYLFVALISGFFIDKWFGKLWMHAVGMVTGTGICYLLGTLWLAHSASLTFKAALMAGVIPYIPADIVKIVIAMAVGVPLRKALNRITPVASQNNGSNQL